MITNERGDTVCSHKTQLSEAIVKCHVKCEMGHRSFSLHSYIATSKYCNKRSGKISTDWEQDTNKKRSIFRQRLCLCVLVCVSELVTYLTIVQLQSHCNHQEVIF